MFKSCVKELPRTGMVDVRISDNVLEEEDWGVDQLYIGSGIVMSQDHISIGVYEIPDMIGWTTERLMEWSTFQNVVSRHEYHHKIKVYAYGN